MNYGFNHLARIYGLGTQREHNDSAHEKETLGSMSLKIALEEHIMTENSQQMHVIPLRLSYNALNNDMQNRNAFIKILHAQYHPLMAFYIISAVSVCDEGGRRFYFKK